MGKIQVLDEHIANQIAAGEVVERPSSVVKELVENAIDAESTRIDVVIEEGGLALIRVTDNGTGMESDDCEIAFFRHATSKIASSKDLFTIRTLGFRGEALPSISAVAKVTCTTSSQTTGLGKKIVIEGGAVKRVEETAAPRGTDIAVRELFYNTPARLKYMKTIQTELGHVSDYMYRLALAHPGIAFSLRHNGNVLLQTLGNGDLLQVIAAVYGTSIAKSMIRLEGRNLDYSIRGYISKPELTRSNRNGISTVINGRYIRNYGIIQALMQGYHTLLPINRLPLAVLHISMDPELVDVNVHPSKLEVRFSKEQELLRFIEGETKIALGGQVLIPSGTAGQQAKSKPAYVQEQLELYRPQAQLQSGAAARSIGSGTWHDPRTERQQADERSAAGSKSEWRKREEDHLEPSPHPAFKSGALAPQAGRDKPKPMAVRAFLDSLQPPPESAATSSAQPIDSLAEEKREDEQPELRQPQLPPFPKLSPIGQLHGTYIVAQNEEGLFLMDQHAAHERINYEHYYELFGAPPEASQELLLPITLEFTASEADRLKDKLHVFQQVGVYLESFGGGTFIVRSIPFWIPSGDEKAIVEEMADWILSERKGIDLSKLREKAAIMCSCKASIKANSSLSMLEMEALFDKLAACSNPYTCPHGRPIVISFSTYELEKMFKRVM
jgi:DNA mismatch repair protein MutL